jgi:hypothetical protein
VSHHSEASAANLADSLASTEELFAVEAWAPEEVVVLLLPSLQPGLLLAALLLLLTLCWQQLLELNDLSCARGNWKPCLLLFLMAGSCCWLRGVCRKVRVACVLLYLRFQCPSRLHANGGWTQLLCWCMSDRMLLHAGDPLLDPLAPFTQDELGHEVVPLVSVSGCCDSS